MFDADLRGGAVGNGPGAGCDGWFVRFLVPVLLALLAFGLWTGLSPNYAAGAVCGSPWSPEDSIGRSCQDLNAREGLFAYTTVPAAVLNLVALAGAAVLGRRPVA